MNKLINSIVTFGELAICLPIALVIVFLFWLQKRGER